MSREPPPRLAAICPARSLTGILACLILSACATDIHVQTDYNANLDFTALQTYSWLESDVSYAGVEDPKTAARVREIIRTTIDERLAAKGYRLIEAARPDFFVSYHVVVTQFEDPKLFKEKVAILDASNPLGAETITVYREDLRIGDGMLTKGTLIVFLLDPDSRRLIWQGLAEGTAVSPRAGIRKAGAATQRIMERFPPTAQR